MGDNRGLEMHYLSGYGGYGWSKWHTIAGELDHILDMFVEKLGSCGGEGQILCDR